MGRIVALAILLFAIVCDRAYAQTDLSGNWAPLYHEDQPERIPGPEVGDYIALPINAAARARAQAWSASLLTLPEHQCKPHPAGYGYRGPSNLRIQQDVDFDTQRVRKITIYIQWMQQFREVWMDGRARPSDQAPHTWQGFSTGSWEGDRLVVRTTHMKAGWVRRNGIPYSDRATFTDTWQRHGNFLTHVSILEDPVYLTEPFVRTTNWVFAPEQRIEAYPCDIVTEVVGHELGYVPHYLPGTNTMLNDFGRKHNVSQEAANGGAHTALPEFVRGAGTSLGADLKVGLYTPRGATPPDVGADLPVGPRAPVESLHVQGNVSLIVTSGGNVVVQNGADGVLVVDTSTEGMAGEVLAAVEKLAPGKTIRYVINTHIHPDHSGGNELIGSKGESLAGGDFARNIGDAGRRATILAHENVQLRMSRDRNGRNARPFNAWPTDTIIAPKKEIFFNGEAIQILHQPSAHTDGDLVVFFRKSDVVVAGDVFVTTAYPRIDMEQGGGINGVIAALNRVIDTTVPRLNQEGGTYVIPGHGRVTDESDVVDYRDMVTIVRDRVADLIKKGMTLEQVKGARPTFDYDGRYGDPTDVVAAIYGSLKP
jgi:glyoxylase-like metal-dependent hydrolase (beta-lactamase superfamily II)